MALVIGTEAADAGMSKAIYEQMDRLLAPPLEQAVAAASGDAKKAAQKALDEARKGWQKLAFSIAHGVVTHLRANLVVRGVQTRGDLNVPVSEQTQGAPPSAHQHGVSLSATQSAVTFTQSNDGTGHVD